MHNEAFSWIAWHAPLEPVTVIDVGGRDINGTVRDLFHPDCKYTVIDLEEGPGVDVVGDFLDYTQPADVVVCCEVAEHCPQWRDLIAHAAAQLLPHGLFLFTAAGPGRAPHSAHDGGQIRDGEWYENINPEELQTVLDTHFETVVVDVLDQDVRAYAR